MSGNRRVGCRRLRIGIIGLIISSLVSSPAEAALVTFKYPDPKATQVALAGEFNEWNKDALPMQKNPAGEWEVQMDLKPGTYEYKYVVDGNWNKANMDNRIIVVKPSAKDLPKESSPPRSIPVQSTPVMSTPVQSVPVQSSPIQSSPVQPTPVLSSPPRSTLVRSTPVRQPAVKAVPETLEPAMTVGVSKGLARKMRGGEGEDAPQVYESKPQLEVPVPVDPPGIRDREEVDPESLVVGFKGLARKPSTQKKAVRLTPPEPIVVVKPVELKAAPMIPVPPPVEKVVEKIPEPEELVPPAPSKKSALIRTNFQYTDAKAKQVTLAGEFNDWNKDAVEMTRKEGGVWEAAQDLKPGRYDYKFVVDGDWDKANKDNRVITVKEGGGGSPPAEPRAAVRQAAQAPKQKTEPAIRRADEVTFRYRNADAMVVGVGGEFNQWNWQASLMKKGPDGVWTYATPMDPGEYAYKFVVDGDWREDPDNPLKKDVDGNQNSMIRVLQAQAQAPEARQDDWMDALESGAKILNDGSVRFVYADPSADQVYLTGSFNSWLPDAWPMMKRSDGIWVASIRLKPGVYTYKYIVDGVWKEDPGNTRTRESGFGPDSVIDVPEPSLDRFKVPVPFSVEAAKAKRVTLAGEFNGWDPGGIALRKTDDGLWGVTIDLKPGKYEYKFLADGDWESLNKENRKIVVK